jgi:hypothetical protein
MLLSPTGGMSGGSRVNGKDWRSGGVRHVKRINGLLATLGVLRLAATAGPATHVRKWHAPRIQTYLAQACRLDGAPKQVASSLEPDGACNDQKANLNIYGECILRAPVTHDVPGRPELAIAERPSMSCVYGW